MGQEALGQEVGNPLHGWMALMKGLPLTLGGAHPIFPLNAAAFAILPQ